MDFNHIYNTGKTLHQLIDDGNIESLEKLLEENPVAVDTLNEEDETPLFRACSNGSTDIAEILLEYGANVSIICKVKHFEFSK